MIFRNREHAARLLAEKLAVLELESPLVLAVPKGAVPMGAIIARQLKSDFDVVLVNKFAPAWQPGLPIGAVAEDGEIFLNRIGRELKYSEESPPASATEQLRRLHQRRCDYTPYRKLINPAGRDVIIVDDAIVTGSTMLTAVRYMERRGARHIVAATPVATENAIERLRLEGVHLSALELSEGIFSVERFYVDFPKVQDVEVARALKSFKDFSERGSHAPI